jgi:hypothetical protein
MFPDFLVVVVCAMLFFFVFLLFSLSDLVYVQAFRPRARIKLCRSQLAVNDLDLTAATSDIAVDLEERAVTISTSALGHLKDMRAKLNHDGPLHIRMVCLF